MQRRLFSEALLRARVWLVPTPRLHRALSTAGRLSPHVSLDMCCTANGPRRHATDIVRGLDLSQVDLLAFVGGDGTAFEGLQVRARASVYVSIVLPFSWAPQACAPAAFPGP